MKRVLSSIGIGAATVDTVLPGGEVRPGDTVAASVELTGGDSTQDISGIYFALKARDGDDAERVLTEFGVDEAISLAPDDERTIPVEFDVPYWTPLTQGEVSVWLETGVDIAWAVDPTDEDRVEVVPDDHTSALFDAVDALGFALHSTQLVDAPVLDDRPFTQTFTFRPTDGYVDALDDLEITVIPREADLRVFLKFDAVDEVADEHGLDFDEQEISVTFEHTNADMMQTRLAKELRRYT